MKPEAVCEVRGGSRRKWLHWFGKDWERHAVGTQFYHQRDVEKLIEERDNWRKQAESLAMSVMSDNVGTA